MKKNLCALVWIFVALTASGAAPSKEIVLLNDNFDMKYLTGGYVGDVQTASVQDLPDSACWYASYRSGGNEPDRANLVFSPETGMTLRFIQDVNAFNVLAHFTDDRNAPITLAVGDSLRLTFTLAVKNPQYKFRSFVIGLLNSHGNPVEQAYYTSPENPTAAFGGYLVSTSFGGTDSNWATVIGKRRPTQDNPSLYHSETVTEEGLTGNFHGPVLNVENGIATEGSLTITRISETENAIVFSFNGLELNGSDTTATFTSFDSVNFSYSGPDSAESLSLHHVKVTLTRNGGD